LHIISAPVRVGEDEPLPSWDPVPSPRGWCLGSREKKVAKIRIEVDWHQISLLSSQSRSCNLYSYVKKNFYNSFPLSKFLLLLLIFNLGLKQCRVIKSVRSSTCYCCSTLNNFCLLADWFYVLQYVWLENGVETSVHVLLKSQ
jgi:hypothetical protein